MTRLLLTIFSVLCMASSALAAHPHSGAQRLKSVTAAADPKPLATATVEFNNAVACIYDPMELADYYIIVSNDPSCAYDKNTGGITISTGYVITFDFWNIASDPAQLPAGIYLPGGEENGYGIRTFDPEYTLLQYYENGALVTEGQINEPIQVVRNDDGTYDINTTYKQGSSEVALHFAGRLPFQASNEKPTAYAMLKKDVDITMGGGISFYQGITDYSKQGVSCINLYSGKFDETTGAMAEDGFNLSMMVAHKRVTKRDNFAVFPGTYTEAMNLARDTWYPCREIEYTFGDQSITMPFGSYIRELNSDSNDRYTYGYLKSGTFIIEEDGEGGYKGTLDAVTDLGYTIKVTFQGKIGLNTDNAQFAATVSNLTDDVDLDFSKIPSPRIYNAGTKGGCRCFKVDIGSPSGKDEGIVNGGDLLRMEFLADAKHSRLQPGRYSVVLDRWNDYELRAGAKYEPYSLNKGYFSGTGGTDGTAYRHFKEGSYCVMDLHGPAEDGYVDVMTSDFSNYTFDINLEDDAGFQIKGVYSAPMIYAYSPEAIEDELAGIGIAPTDAIDITLVGRNLCVTGAPLGSNVDVTALTGVKLLTSPASEPVDLSHLTAGIYLISVNNRTFKISLK